MNNSTDLTHDSAEDSHDIWLTGELMPGALVSEVVGKLAELFKLPPSKIAIMLQQGGICLKKQLPFAAAAKYRQVIEAAGAVICVKPHSCAPLTSTHPTKHPQQPVAIKPRPLQSVPIAVNSTDLWTLTRLDEPLLSVEEKLVFISRLDEFETFELKPQTGFILTAEEKHEVLPLLIPDTNWQVADVGTPLLGDAERKVMAVPVEPPSDWTLAEAGERLIDAAPQSKSAPNVSYLSLVEQ